MATSEGVLGNYIRSIHRGEEEKNASFWPLLRKHFLSLLGRTDNNVSNVSVINGTTRSSSSPLFSSSSSFPTYPVLGFAQERAASSLIRVCLSIFAQVSDAKIMEPRAFLLLQEAFSLISGGVSRPNSALPLPSISLFSSNSSSSSPPPSWGASAVSMALGAHHGEAVRRATLLLLPVAISNDNTRLLLSLLQLIACTAASNDPGAARGSYAALCSIITAVSSSSFSLSPLPRLLSSTKDAEVTAFIALCAMRLAAVDWTRRTTVVRNNKESLVGNATSALQILVEMIPIFEEEKEKEYQGGLY